MELHEFKELFEADSESKTLTDKYNTEKINSIIMKTNATVGKLHRTNTFWWNFAKVSTILLLLSLALNVITFLASPDKFPQMGKALPFLGIIAVFGLTSLWTYYEQLNIFDIGDSQTMKNAIETSIRRFKRFYLLMNVTYLVMLPPVFYAGSLLFQMGFHRVEFIFSLKEVLQSVILTAIAMGASHLYYKRNYFRRLSELKRNLNELDEGGTFA
ncbi:hypothetical protein [Desertivirga brevis]|uniref:hypothetical protein n=1 Tax=Desertivirga brevis TaxID=2810310 RepID=UPI001A97BBF0|nr:hypothetical protein [Pedobacter sp. SYSU D00873]